MQQLGPTRDWDVFDGTTIARLATAAPEVDFGGLREAAQQQRKSNYATLQGVLADPRCSRFLLSLGNWVERRGWRNEIESEALAALSQPMPALADKILAKRHRKVLRRGAHFRRLDTNAQHDLRIDLKKLRYAAEFFLPLYATHARAKRYVKRLARLQNSLGRARDTANIRTLLGHQAGRSARAPSRRRRNDRLAGPRPDCRGENAAQEMAAVQGDAGILGPVSSLPASQ
jgi:CHAD domain-containing protein